MPVSYRRMEDGSRPVGRAREMEAGWPSRGPRLLLAPAAHREENIGHHINECHVRSSARSLTRSPPEKITHFYDHPKERKERRRKMVSLVRVVVCRDGRAIEQTTRPTRARPNKMGFCGWWRMHMKSHVHRVVASGVGTSCCST